MIRRLWSVEPGEQLIWRSPGGAFATQMSGVRIFELSDGSELVFRGVNRPVVAVEQLSPIPPEMEVDGVAGSYDGSLADELRRIRWMREGDPREQEMIDAARASMEEALADPDEVLAALRELAVEADDDPDADCVAIADQFSLLFRRLDSAMVEGRPPAVWADGQAVHANPLAAVERAVAYTVSPGDVVVLEMGRQVTVGGVTSVQPPTVAEAKAIGDHAREVFEPLGAKVAILWSGRFAGVVRADEVVG